MYHVRFCIRNIWYSDLLLCIMIDSVFGTSGILSYTVEGTDLQVEVLWSVPLFYGPESNRFNVEVRLYRIIAS